MKRYYLEESSFVTMSGEIPTEDLIEGLSCAEVSLINASDTEYQPTLYRVFNVIQVLYYIPLMVAGVLLKLAGHFSHHTIQTDAVMLFIFADPSDGLLRLTDGSNNALS